MLEGKLRDRGSWLLTAFVGCWVTVYRTVADVPRNLAWAAALDKKACDGRDSHSLETLRSDFAGLARKFSQDATSASRGVLVPAFEDAAFALQVGETSDLVRTEFGFHVIQRMPRAKP